MSKVLLAILFLFVISNANAAVRQSPLNGRWEGNICMNNMGWQIVNWQPLGTTCWFILPGYGRVQGVIINY